MMQQKNLRGARQRERIQYVTFDGNYTEDSTGFLAANPTFVCMVRPFPFPIQKKFGEDRTSSPLNYTLALWNSIQRV